MANGVSISPSVPGQLSGSATNDNALTGNVGEYASASLAAASALVLSNASATTIVALPLSAGDWDVWGTGVFVSGVLTVSTLLSVGINSTAAQPAAISGALSLFGLGAGLTGIGTTTLAVPPVRLSLAAAGTAFLMGSLAFSVSTASAYGIIQARRRR